jgi:hypothetical protein
MIKINKGQIGFFDIALSDKFENYTSNEYDFTFINELTSEVVALTLTDTSIFFDRFSRFDYTDTDFANSNTGFYRYKIEQNGNLITTGRMFLFVNPQPFVSYDGYDKSISVYDKQFL